MKTESFNKTFSNRLRYYLEINNMTQKELSQRLNVSATSVYNWCSAVKTPRMKYIDQMCNIFHCERIDLTDKPSETSNHKVKIKVLGRVAAGIPIDAVEEILGYEEIPEDMARTGEFFALRIKGDSMSPHICDGDTVIVRRQSDADSDQIIIAQVNGSDATCKRLMKYNGGISLISFNPLYNPMSYTAEQIRDLPVEIIGRVVEDRRKY